MGASASDQAQGAPHTSDQRHSAPRDDEAVHRSDEVVHVSVELSKGEPEPAKLADEGLGENGLGDKGLGDIGLDDDIVRSRYELDRLIGRGGFITGACSSS